ncbi:MAG TPA: DUF3291 domain-containing protein [Acidimicrobiia bacterium]|nr:DUF3291 domain-containing protein [Acidimicrobiia bacterium]
MPAIPWRNLSRVEPGREYLVMASRLPLISHWRIPMFMRLTLVVARQLNRTPGLVGYGLLARPIAKTFWTLSAWEDRQALAAFTRAMPHLQVMKDLQPHMMSTTKFTQWAVPGSSLPVSWVDAFAQLGQQEPLA